MGGAFVVATTAVGATWAVQTYANQENEKARVEIQEIKDIALKNQLQIESLIQVVNTVNEKVDDVILDNARLQIRVEERTSRD